MGWGVVSLTDSRSKCSSYAETADWRARGAGESLARIEKRCWSRFESCLEGCERHNFKELGPGRPSPFVAALETIVKIGLWHE